MQRLNVGALERWSVGTLEEEETPAGSILLQNRLVEVLAK